MDIECPRHSSLAVVREAFVKCSNESTSNIGAPNSTTIRVGGMCPKGMPPRARVPGMPWGQKRGEAQGGMTSHIEFSNFHGILFFSKEKFNFCGQCGEVVWVRPTTHTVYCPTGPLSPTALPHDTAPQHSKGTGFYKRNLTLETDVAEVDRVGRLEPLDLQVDDWDLTDI